MSEERPCPMATVTFTCTSPGNLLRWDPSDVPQFDVDTRFTPLNMPEMTLPGYTVTLIAFNETSLTSTLSRRSENGITVTFLDPPSVEIYRVRDNSTGQ